MAMPREAPRHDDGWDSDLPEICFQEGGLRSALAEYF
jgi:hypothetical protein